MVAQFKWVPSLENKGGLPSSYAEQIHDGDVFCQEPIKFYRDLVVFVQDWH